MSITFTHIGLDNKSNTTDPITTDNTIPCLAFEEIHPTAEQIAKSPDDMKHGIIVFAGGHVILHLKQDVLIDNLVENEIQRRLAEERERHKSNDEANQRSRGHDTDLIPGVYEGNHHHNNIGFERRRQRPLHAFDRNHNHRKRHSNATKHHRNGNQSSYESSSASSYRYRKESRHEERISSSRLRRDAKIKPQATTSKPSQRPRRNELRHPWFNQEMAALIGLREKAHRKWAANKQRRKGDTNWEAFKKCRSAVSALRRVRRNEYLVAALQVDAFASAQPWQTKGIAKSALSMHSPHTPLFQKLPFHTQHFYGI